MSAGRDVPALTGIAAFTGFSRESLLAIEAAAERLRLARGDLLFRMAEPADSAFVLLSGRLRLALETRSGRTSRTIGEVKPRTLMDASALLVEGVRAATATATEPSLVLRIGRAAFRAVLHADPAGAGAFRESLAAQLDSTLKQLDAARRLAVEGRPPA